MELNLEKTKTIISGNYKNKSPHEDLIYLLQSVIELLSISENDFSWSSWKNATDAISEVEDMIVLINKNDYSKLESLGVIFTPTGPLQEVSISSGWSDVFIKIANKYDILERKLLK